MSYIRFNNVSFSYGDKPILQNFSLDIAEGRKVALKGESGMGKSTILRLLLGFEPITAGQIFFKDQAVSADHFAAIRRSVSWLPQDLNIGDGMVQEVIHRPFEFQQNSRQKVEEQQITDLFQRLGLPGDILRQPLRELSTGQRQRVGIALCRLLDRPLMLLDEPTSALDQNSKQKAADVLLSEPGRTVISTTHDPFWLERCDKIIEL